MLGPLEVDDDGRQVALGGPKPRALLAILLLQRGEVVPAERLIELLYEGVLPENATKSVQTHVSRLRKALGDGRLRTTGGGYAIDLSPDELDLDRFERLIEEGRVELAAGRLEAAAHAFGQAVALWRGPPFADFRYSDFAQGEIARLEERRLVALSDRLDADLALGRHVDLVPELEALVRAHPLRERLRAQLMLALYRSGRQAEALEAYQAARRTLTEELGIEPSQELRDLQAAILQQDRSLDLLRQAAGTNGVGDESRSILVGREDELEALQTGLEGTFAGRGSLFLLVGEPGIGKSRLANEVLRRAHARGSRVLVGRCWEAGGAPAYWPWVQSLRSYVRETDRDVIRAQIGLGAGDLAQLLPEIRELFPDTAVLPELESESSRFRLFDATAAFLKNAARTQPLVLFLDDLHAADESSLLLLQFVTRELGDSRMLVLAAYRDVDPTPTVPLAATVTELVREPVTRTISLGGLDEHDIARYIQLICGEATSDELVGAIYEETEGNPLFVGEIVRLLKAEGRLDSPTRTSLVLPQTVHDVIARRLRYLSEECNRALVLASVLGREFSVDVLAHMAEMSTEDLFEVLDHAVDARVLSDVRDTRGGLAFAHVLIRDTLYDHLTTARRVRLHRRAAEALEGVYGTEPGWHFAELAHHAIAGSDFARGLEYAKRAGDWALEAFAYEEAARLYETALDALDLVAAPERRRCELLLSAGEAETRAGERSNAKTSFFSAAAIARRLNLPNELARAALGYAGQNWARPSRDERLVPLLEEALRAIGKDDIEPRARLLARLAGALRDEHSRGRRDALSQEAVELARRTGNPATVAAALDGRAAALIAPDTVRECVALGREVCEIARQIGDKEKLIQGIDICAVGYMILGEVERVLADLDVALQAAEELRRPIQLWHVYGDQAMTALATGKLSEGEQLMQRAFDFGERAQPELAVPVYQLQRYMLCEYLGGHDGIEGAIRELARDRPRRIVFRCVLVHLLARLGRRAQAQALLNSLASERFGVVPFDQEWLYAVSLLAEAVFLIGDVSAAAVLYELLLPWRDLNAANLADGMCGSVSRYLGLVATTLERWDAAAVHFEHALEANMRMGASPWVALTQEDYGRMRLARNQPGDNKHAELLIEDALDMYRELGMTGALERAHALV